MEPGLEHLGKQCTRTGTYGGRKPWTGRPGKKRPGMGMSGATEGGGNAAKKSGEEHMDMSKDQMGKDTTDERREVGGEGGKGKAANHV